MELSDITVGRGVPLMYFIASLGTLATVIVGLLGVIIKRELDTNNRDHRLLWFQVRRLYRRVDHLIRHSPHVPAYTDPPEDRQNGREEVW